MSQPVDLYAKNSGLYATRGILDTQRMGTSMRTLWHAILVTAIAMHASVAMATDPPTISYNSTSSNRGITQDWDPCILNQCYYKASCGTTEALLGVSEHTDTGNGNLALCAPLAQPGSVSTLTPYVASATGLDNRGYKRHGDWAWGYVKVECGLDEYGVAISQSWASPRVAHGIACIKGTTGADTWGITTVRQMDDNSSMGSSTWGNWDLGKHKGQCIDGESIVGASFSRAGRLHSILCRGAANLQLLYQPSSGSGLTAASILERGATPAVRNITPFTPAGGKPPAMTNFLGQLYALYASSSNQLCIATSANRGLTYSAPTCMSQVQLSDTPAVLNYHGSLYVAYASTTSPKHLMVASSSDGANFTVTSYDGIALDASPGIAALDGVLYAGYVKSNLVCVTSLQSTRRASKSCPFSAKAQPVGMAAAFGKLWVTYSFATNGLVSYMVSPDPSSVPFAGWTFTDLASAQLISPAYYHGNLYLVSTLTSNTVNIVVSTDGINFSNQPTTGLVNAAGPVGIVGTNIADTIPSTLFAVYGDMPYTTGDATMLSTQILPGLSSSTNVPLILHMGDAGRPDDGTGTAAFDSCSDSFRSQNVESWQSVNQPIVFMPGDNDWTDCNQERKPRSRLDPLKAFASVRSIFAGNASVDAPSYDADSLNAGLPSLSQSWVSNNVLYLGLNIVGSYNGYVPSTKINAAARNAEVDDRAAQTMAAITSAGVAMMSNPSLKALVVTFHVDPYYDGTAVDWSCSMTDLSGRQPYKSICANLVTVANSIGRPMLIVHGDTSAHCFRPHPNSSNLWVLNAPGDYDPGVDLVSFNPANMSAPFSAVTMTNSAGVVPTDCDYSHKLAAQPAKALAQEPLMTATQPQQPAQKTPE